MRICFILISLLCYNFLAAQIQLSYVFKDTCTDSVLVKNYNLLLLRQFVHYHSTGADLTIDSAGAYVIDAGFHRGNRYAFLSFYRSFKDHKSYQDTITVPKLLKDVMGLHSSGQTYSYCDSPADGYIEDYYNNGNLRLKGTFKNGNPEETLTFYNVNGVIIKREIYKKGKFYRTKYFNKKDLSEDY